MFESIGPIVLHQQQFDTIAPDHHESDTSDNNHHQQQAHMANVPLEQAISSMSLSGGMSAANNNSNKLGRLVSKKAARVKELLLQNVGRADRTTDQLFDSYEENFYKQQNHAIKLAKEFKIYLNSMRGFHEASKHLNKCIQQSTCDYQTARHDLVCENLSQLDSLNDDLLEKLREQVMQNVGEYLTQFSELKGKIAKRRRKLIDFDASKRNYELMLAQMNKRRLRQQQDSQQQQQQDEQQHQMADGNNQQQQQKQQSSLSKSLKFLSQQNDANTITATANQLVDEARLLKLREQYNYCKIMYETINSELHDELPNVYEKKMKNLLITLQNYFAIEAHYHSNAGKLTATVSDVIDELPNSMLACLSALATNKCRRQTMQSLDSDHTAASSIIQGGTRIGKQQLRGVATGELRYDSSGGLLVDDEMYGDGEKHDGADQVTGLAAKGPSGAGGMVGGACSSSGMGSSRGDSSCMESQSSASSDSCSAIVEPLDGNVDDVGGISSQDHGPSGAEMDVGADNDDEDEHEHHGQPSGKGEPSAGVAQSVDGRGEQSARSSVCKSDSMAKANECDEQEPEEQVASEPTIATSSIVHASAHVVDGDEELECSVSDLHDSAPLNPKNDEAADDAANQEKMDEVEVVVDGGAVVNGQPRRIGDCLYKVKTNYKYLAEDVDELCFEADEIIQVIEFDETHEPEDGWLLGIREANGQRGLFPANFTRPL